MLRATTPRKPKRAAKTAPPLDPRSAPFWTRLQQLAQRLDVSPVDLVGSLLRPMIVAAPGHKLVSADFSAIEARVVAWLAGEEWALDAYRSGRDIYCEFGSEHLFTDLGRPITKKDEDERALSKAAVLAGGFQLGPRTFAVRMALAGVNLAGKHPIEVIEAYRDSMPGLAGSPTGGVWIDVESEKFGLAPADAAALQALLATAKEKRWGIAQQVDEAQRQYGIRLHPRKQRKGGYWKALHEAGLAVGAAIRDMVWQVGGCTFRRRGPDVFVELPSGRELVYPDARIEPVTADGRDESDWRIGTEQFVYEDVNGRQGLYAGKYCENIVQAIAYDLMAEVAADAEEAGWPLVLTVHDEVLLEVEEARAEECQTWLLDRMAATPAWAEGLPLASEAKVADWYQK